MEGGYKEIRENFAPLVEKVLPSVQPSVVTGYATLLWFTSKIYTCDVELLLVT